MKKLFLLILILVSNLFAQGWNDIVTTDIGETQQQDIFTNSSGIHILVKDLNNNIVYYKLNSAGNVAKTYTFETSGEFPNIVGSNDKIFVIYYYIISTTSKIIRVRYSTNNGESWLYDVQDRQTTINYCNGVDAVYDLGNGVHIVYATQDGNGGTSGFETYYRRLAPDNSWADAEYKNVTDYSTEDYGGNPSVVVSPNRVHVSFNTDPTTSPSGLGDVKTRDKYYSSWQDPQTVVPGTNEQKSLDERLLVRGGYLFLFYNREHPGADPNDLVYRTRLVGDTNWSDPTPLESALLRQEEDAFEITKTNNNYIHILYKKHLGSPIGWAYTYKYSSDGGTNWSTINDFDHNSVSLRQIGLSSVSNDLFCTWVKMEPITFTKYFCFRQYDAIPLAPTGLTISEDVNHHPRLNWNANPEPDIHHYIIERYDTYGGGWQYLNQTPNGTTYTYTDETLTYCHAVPPAQCPNVRTFYFRVKAVDIKPHTSPASNQVEARLRGGPPSKIVADPGSNELIEYSLSQNYPNPFNPTTSIDYSIKANGLVTLKVYDMLGTEVASLINEVKEPGNYSVKFNASELPSGIYFYTLTSENFLDTKKLILLK